ncbi:MAG TPA: Stp1/IreP family PP2C-type Ser/Thr phosphatase [Actinomycetota bacterium]|nr:Stp1/IreP family PP2C-type Ser/Thr phosphatase [Actinomycetota bacterium]
MRVRAGVKTDVGRFRERNEDAYLVKEPLYVVADGMGGHRGGNVASSMAVDVLEQADLSPDAPLSVLIDEIKRANQEILERSAADQALRGMGTTVTAFLTDQDKGYVAHVGDSRAYLLRDGNLQRLTRDHSLVERMVEEGRLEPDQARHHPQQNILTRVLGGNDDLEVDDLTVDPIQEGDRVLLCTDGLSHMVDDEVIEGILRDEEDPQAAADRLVDAAIDAGGDDNVTVIVLDVEEGGPAGSVAPVRSDVSTEREEGEPADHREARPTGRHRRRWAIALAIVAVLVVATVIGTRLYVGQQWYVGETAGRVAIYNGIPTEVFGFGLSHVEETTDLSAAQVNQLPIWRDRLADGITADSLADAEQLVAQMRADVQAAQGPTK